MGYFGINGGGGERSIYKIDSFRQYPASKHLDFIRGLAAIEVLFSHFRNLFFVDRADIINNNFFVRFLYFITEFGHQSVIIFFVLSGFFVSSSILRSYHHNRWSWKIYLINRLSRIETVLIPAIILTYIWDSLGIHYFGSGGVYGGNGFGSYVCNYFVPARLTLTTLFSNLLFLNNVFTPTFGSNASLWSLANEWWYYIAFPLCISLCLFRSKLDNKSLIFSVFCLSIVIYLIVEGKANHGWLIWLFGTCVAIAPVSVTLIKNRQIAYGVATLSLMVLIASLISVKTLLVNNNLLADLLIGCTTAFLIYSLCNINQEPQLLNRDLKAVDREMLYEEYRQLNWLEKSKNVSKIFLKIYSRLGEFLARFSYTLYLVHLPILTFAKAYLLTVHRWQPDILHIVWGLALISVVLIYAISVYFLTEAKTDQVRAAFVQYSNPLR